MGDRSFVSSEDGGAMVKTGGNLVVIAVQNGKAYMAPGGNKSAGLMEVSLDTSKESKPKFWTPVATTN